MKNLVYILLACCLSTQALAQSDMDALRFSSTNINLGTARSVGLAGAVGALGADPSSLANNPGGLAQYKSNTFSISVDMYDMGSSSSYLNGEDIYTNAYKASIPNFSLIFANRKMVKGQYAKTGWVNTNFALSYSKVADYNSSFSYAGVNQNSSYLDAVAQYVQGLRSSELDANEDQLNYGFDYFENMFWYAYLIDTVKDRDYQANYDVFNPDQYQNGRVRTKGSLGEWGMTMAANYEHKFYIGFGLHLDQLWYNELNMFREEDNPLTNGNWESFEFNRSLSTKGIGVGGRLGMVFRPNDQLRVGATIHSPKWIRLHDDYSDELDVVYDNGGTESLKTIEKYYDYQLITPMKYALQAVYLIGKLGLITAEIENTDFGTMFLSDDDGTFDDLNQSIARKYSQSTQVKLGGELSLGVFKLRGGLARISSPFRNEHSFTSNMTSFGFGLYDRDWSFDLGYSKMWSKDEYTPYQLSGIENGQVSSNFNTANIVLTLNMRF